jgi:hypothetical protein
MHLCDVGEEPGPHLFQVSFRFFFFFVLINVWKNKNLPTTTTTIYRLIRSRESPREKKGQQKITISEKQRDVG